MSGSPRYIFNDDWFHCTAAATAVRPQNNHLLADLKQNCFHSVLLIRVSVELLRAGAEGQIERRTGNEVFIIAEEADTKIIMDMRVVNIEP